jgi:hypothetical protein
MPVFLSEQLKEAGAIRIEILKTLNAGNKRFLLWVTEMDNHSMVHEFSSLLSIDTFSSVMEEEETTDSDYSTILLTRLDEDEESSLESVSIGCLNKDAALKLKDFIKSFVQQQVSASSEVVGVKAVNNKNKDAK